MRSTLLALTAVATLALPASALARPAGAIAHPFGSHGAAAATAAKLAKTSNGTDSALVIALLGAGAVAGSAAGIRGARLRPRRTLPQS